MVKQTRRCQECRRVGSGRAEAGVFYCDSCWARWEGRTQGSRGQRHRAGQIPERESRPPNVAAVEDGYDGVMHAWDNEAARPLWRDVQNDATRDFLEGALGGMRISLLVDAACGKGGAAVKYVDFLEQNARAVLADVSKLSIQEARERVRNAQSGTSNFAIRWRQVKWETEQQDVFTEAFWRRFADGEVDVVICNFALHYASDASGQRLRRVLNEIHRVLRPGGIFMGITVDAAAMACAAANPDSCGLFRISGFPDNVRLGGRYVFELPGSVPAVEEYLLPMDDLLALGVDAGLAPVQTHPAFWGKLTLSHPDLRSLGSHQDVDDALQLCSLYYCFVFEKPPRLATPVPRQIAVYKGTFDPMHLNHAGLCRYLTDTEGFEHVYVVPNGDSPLKPYAIAFEHRREMARLALQDQGVSARCSVESGEREGSDWKGRLALCKRFRKRHPGASAYLVLGQDSFESSVLRAKQGQRRNAGIFAVPTSGQHILVLRRAGFDAEIDVPVPLARVVRVVKDYKDPVQLSSTAARTAAASNDGLEYFVGNRVAEYVRENQLYQPVQLGKGGVAVLNMPGVSNSAFCAHLAQLLQRAGGSWRHMNTQSLPSAPDSCRFVVEGLSVAELASFERDTMPIDAVVLRSDAPSEVSDGSWQQEILQSFRGTGRLLVTASASEGESDLAGLMTSMLPLLDGYRHIGASSEAS